jgi:hypothetical protein
MGSTPSIDTKTTTALPEAEAPEENLKATDIPANADLAAGFLLNAEGYNPLSPEDEKKLLHKIDWIMIPMVSCSY